MARSWKMFEKDGKLEPFLVDNPPLIIVNAKEKKHVAKTIRMRRNRKGQFVKASSNPPSHKRKSTKRHHSRANPPNPHHRRRRHNPPEVIGVPLPDLMDVLSVSAGFAAPPIIQGLAASLAPTAMANKTTKTIVQVGSWVAPPLLALGLFGKPVAKRVVQGELAALGVQAIQSVVTTLQAQITGQKQAAGYFTPRRDLLSAYSYRPGGTVDQVGSYYDPNSNMRAAPNFPARRLPVRLQSRFS